LPAIAAGLASFLASWIHSLLQTNRPNDKQAAIYLAALSTLMGGICSYYRLMVFGHSLGNNILVMSFVAGLVTFVWFLLRRHMPGMQD
jgi:hypothetical protein